MFIVFSPDNISFTLIITLFYMVFTQRIYILNAYTISQLLMMQAYIYELLLWDTCCLPLDLKRFSSSPISFLVVFRMITSSL